MDAVDPLSLPLSHLTRRSSESFASSTLSSVHISQAIQRSSDHGATLMFSKMNLSDVGVNAAEELASLGKERPEDENTLKRITLGNNRLTTLPMEFALLSQLRYLNLKRNNFSVFPDVLTQMPSLDTLDISHNRIKKLPVEAGHLVHLRIFSLARNKITQLPSYLSQFSNLEILQVERNPIEWPPKVVMEKADNLDSRNTMKDWVRGLQQWIAADYHSQIRDDGEQLEVETYISENYNSWKFPLREKNITPHNRSFSVDSSVTTSSTSDSTREAEIANPLCDEVSQSSPLHHGILGPFSVENSPTHALESYLPSPADSEFFEGNPIPTSFGDIPHARNASYDNGGSYLSTDPNLTRKKSIPDLQISKLDFHSKKNTGLVDVVPARLPISQDPNTNDLLISTLPKGQDSDFSLSSQRAERYTPQELNQKSPTQSTSSMASQRNSYFQRLSVLPISTALPQPLLCLIESARSILFAMCQVFQTLEYFIADAIDDRISSVLRKVLDPASTDMTQLINSLERFDATSRKSLPPPVICRGVLESCRNTVAVFSKAVGVLALQLQVIVTGDDVRYSRWILLELYGATAELTSAWETIVPHIEVIRPFLHSKTFTGQPPPLALNSLPSDPYLVSPTSIVPLPPDSSQTSLRTQPGVPRGKGAVRTTRRHAGSFSSKDVELGKQLPSYDDVPGLFGGIVSGTARSTPTPRAPKRQAAIPTTTISSPSPANTTLFSPSLPSSSTLIDDSPRSMHSRQSSQASFQTSASSSPSVPTKAIYQDLPSTSKSQVDKEALQAVQAAVRIAPSVWDMIENLFDEDFNTKLSAHEALKMARTVTARLTQTLQAIQMHDFDLTSDRKDFREDAHAFLKIVVQLSNIIKTYKGSSLVSSTLRTGMVKLTNSTEEFAILLHVSSFTTSTPRSYTPLITNPAGPEDLRLGSSLSRSQSAYPSGNFKVAGNTHDGNTLLSQTLKLPVTRQLRSKEGMDSPMADPG